MDKIRFVYPIRLLYNCHFSHDHLGIFPGKSLPPSAPVRAPPPVPLGADPQRRQPAVRRRTDGTAGAAWWRRGHGDVENATGLWKICWEIYGKCWENGSVGNLWEIYRTCWEHMEDMWKTYGNLVGKCGYNPLNAIPTWATTWYGRHIYGTCWENGAPTVATSIAKNHPYELA